MNNFNEPTDPYKQQKRKNLPSVGKFALLGVKKTKEGVWKEHILCVKDTLESFNDNDLEDYPDYSQLRLKSILSYLPEPEYTPLAQPRFVGNIYEGNL